MSALATAVEQMVTTHLSAFASTDRKIQVCPVPFDRWYELCRDESDSNDCICSVTAVLTIVPSGVRHNS